MIEDAIVREFATQLLNYACAKWTGGRDEDDPVYREVTENRDVGAMQRSYSSCGDLAHWVLFRLGCRSQFLNRQEHRGWKPGKNVSLLAFSPVAENAQPSDRYAAGDVLIIWSKEDGTDAHVMVALSHEPGDDEQSSVLTCAEYGQPGGKVIVHRMKEPLMVGRRKIRKVLRLSRVLSDADAQQLLVEPDYTTLPKAQAYAIENAPKD
jgi:hypothetical protein